MVFTFDHYDVDGLPNEPLKPISWHLSKFKAIISRWQTYIQEAGGWNTICMESHDQGRSVSRFGSDSDERVRSLSAKMLALLCVGQSGTIFIYQGQEIAMANVPKSWSLDEYKDIASQQYWDQ